MIFTPAFPFANPFPEQPRRKHRADKSKTPFGFRGVDTPLAATSTFRTAFFGGGEGLLGNKCCSRIVFLLLLRGLSSRFVWAGPIRSGGSPPASSGFPALSSPPTLWYLLSRERERERKELFIFDATEATCINPFFGRATCLKRKSCADPSSSRGIRF